jgi:hypothetical protein
MRWLQLLYAELDRRLTAARRDGDLASYQHLPQIRQRLQADQPPPSGAA